MLSRLRGIARRLKRGLEQKLHPRRHRRAVDSLQSLGRPVSIVFVCLGNICRSPYAEHRLRAEIAAAGVAEVTVESLGFIRPGRPSPPIARRVSTARGVELADHRSRVVAPAALAETDLAVVMSAKQRKRLHRLTDSGSLPTIVLGDLDPQPIETRTIPDPYDQAEEVFEAVYDRIDRCCRAMANALAAGGR